MPVRAIDDKPSDTLVVVSGEGSWTGSSTLPHLHHHTMTPRSALIAMPPSGTLSRMQVFRPEDVDLSTVPPNPTFGAPTGDDLPVMRSAVRQESRDGGLRSGIWDSAAGTATFRHTADEWAYILEGEVEVTAAGQTHHLKAGDVFYTPAGETMVWVVPRYIRKVWVHRRPPIVGRIRRKLGRMLANARR